MKIEQIKQLARGLYKMGHAEVLALTHNQQRLIERLYHSVHTEQHPGEPDWARKIREDEEQSKANRAVCSHITNCGNMALKCGRCIHNQILTRGSDWSPTDWYAPVRPCGIGQVWFAKGSDFEIIDGYSIWDIYKKQQLKNQQNMKVEIELDKDQVAQFVDGKETVIEVGSRKYKMTPVEEELTLEDCVKDNMWVNKSSGDPKSQYGRSLPYFNYDTHPTSAIAEKVLLYGL